MYLTYSFIYIEIGIQYLNIIMSLFCFTQSSGDKLHKQGNYQAAINAYNAAF